MTWHPVKQNSDEPCPCCGKSWMELRAGKVTGSSIGRVMAWHDKPMKNGSPKWGDPAKRLAVEIAVVELGGDPTGDSYSNSNMERGHEQEPIARQLYERETFSEVTNGGFYDNGRTGASPDGRTNPKGIVEIKAVINHVHYERIENGGVDPKYWWQCIHNLKESSCDWIEYISFCSTFERSKRLYTHRLFASDLKKEFGLINSRLSDFYVLVESVKNKILAA